MGLNQQRPDGKIENDVVKRFNITKILRLYRIIKNFEN
jgi:hypothetical protein